MPACRVPVPDRVVGGARHDLEALFAAPKLVLGLLAFGDVLADAHQLRWARQRRRRSIVPWLWSMRIGPVRANDSLFELERRAGAKRLLDRRSRRVLGRRDGRVRDSLRMWARIHRAHTKDPAQLLRAIHGVGRDVPLVAAELRDALRFGELRLPRLPISSSARFRSVMSSADTHHPDGPAGGVVFALDPVAAIQCTRAIGRGRCGTRRRSCRAVGDRTLEGRLRDAASILGMHRS